VHDCHSLLCYILLRRGSTVLYYLRCLTLLSLRWKRYIPPKRRWFPESIHGITCKKMAIFVAKAVGMSNLACSVISVFEMPVCAIPLPPGFRSGVRGGGCPSTDRYRLVHSAQPYRSSGPSPSRSETGGELSTASVELSPPTCFIVLWSSPVGELAVFFEKVFCITLVNPLRGRGGVRKGRKHSLRIQLSLHSKGRNHTLLGLQTTLYSHY
jgi:hypothetical protein